MKYTSHKKIIPYQIIINFQKEIETYHAFDDYFQALFDSFELTETPDKQELFTGNPINHSLLTELYHEYQQLGIKLDKELRTMKHAEAIKPQPIKEAPLKK